MESHDLLESSLWDDILLSIPDWTTAGCNANSPSVETKIPISNSVSTESVPEESGQQETVVTSPPRKTYPMREHTPPNWFDGPRTQ